MYNQVHVSSYLSFVKGNFNWAVNVAHQKVNLTKMECIPSGCGGETCCLMLALWVCRWRYSVYQRVWTYFRWAILHFTAPCHSTLYNDVRNAWSYVVDYVKKRPSSNTRDFMEIFHVIFHLKLLFKLRSYTQYRRS